MADRDATAAPGRSPAGAVDEASSEVEAPAPQDLKALQAENERLRGALKEIAEHPESGNSYAVGWAFWNVQRVASTALRPPLPRLASTSTQETTHDQG